MSKVVTVHLKKRGFYKYLKYRNAMYFAYCPPDYVTFTS